MNITEAEAKTKEYRALQKEIEGINEVLGATPSQVTIKVKAQSDQGTAITHEIDVTANWPVVADVLSSIGEDKENAAADIESQFQPPTY